MTSKTMWPAILMICGILPVAAQWATAQQSGARTTPVVSSLDGDWRFVADPRESLKPEDLGNGPNVRTIHVPSSWQMQFDDLRDYSGVAWYWRSFNAPRLDASQVALLDFGAVDYRADVFVNGRRVGSHDGGYLPFEFDVTSLLRAGQNQVLVRVADPGPKHPVEGIVYAEIPHGKQNWYVENSGIWQPVELKILPKVHLGTVHITAIMDGHFAIQAHVVNLPDPGSSSQSTTARAEIIGPDGKLVWKLSTTVEPGHPILGLSGKLSKPELWSLKHPWLYTLRVQLSSGDKKTYEFGFRTIDTQNGKFYLNGKPIYLRGVLDQDFFPDTGYVPPSLDCLVAEMKKAKAIGLNLLRCHIKIPDPRYFEAADKVGIMVWYEIPNWDKLTPDSESRALDALRGMARRDWNHPSIIQVSIINESWGADLKQASDRAWLKRTYEEAKKIVPWHVDDNSPCCSNFHLATDIADFHDYDAIPDHAADFDRFVSDLATRPAWLFSPDGDAEPKGGEPLVLSEFGNWGLPVLPPERPWWFSRSLGGNRFTLPDGFERRYRKDDYDSLFPNLKALSEATEWHEFQALRYEIGSLRMHPEIQGYVITEFNDTNWESNGLFDAWRNPKVFEKDLGALQQDDALILRAGKRNFYSGSAASVAVYFSHYSLRSAAGATVTWQIEGTTLQGHFALPSIAPGTAVRLGQIKFTVPDAPAPERGVLRAKVMLKGRAIAENSLELFFYPKEKLELPPPVSFHDPHGALRRLESEMRERGYEAASGHEAFPVLIASAFDPKVIEVLDSGGRVILLPDGAQNIGAGIEVVARKGDLSGDWISDFPWARTESAPFKGIGFDSLQGFETQAVTPEEVVRGVPPEDFGDVLAGLFYGWLRDNVGTLVQSKYGKGRLLICTFSLAASYGTDPYATTFLDALVKYAASDLNPRWQISP